MPRNQDSNAWLLSKVQYERNIDIRKVETYDKLKKLGLLDEPLKELERIERENRIKEIEIRIQQIKSVIE